MTKRVQILYHGNCFDGMMSAALFTAFYRARVDQDAQLSYRGMSHKQGDPYGDDHDETFWADENAVVDFRYSPSPRLTWWCDHHQSAFIQPEHRAHFETEHSLRKCFDPSAPSCAGLLARWLAQDHGFDATQFAEHLHWADLIDAARFESPRQAVELVEPPLQLMALLETAPPPEFVEQLILGLAQGSIEQVHGSVAVQERLEGALEVHRHAIDVTREQLKCTAGVAFADLSDTDVNAPNKFLPYYLHDDVAYTVVVTHSSSRAKVSVGSNPWQRPDPLINLAELCGRYGGGGHAVVAGISLPPGEIEQARRAASEIVATLRGG